jgi:hypothetical protein
LKASVSPIIGSGGANSICENGEACIVIIIFLFY